MSIFGTDGIRGLVNEYPMTPEIAMKIALILGNKSIMSDDQRCLNRIVIGKDTRKSCYMLESAMTAGFIAAGIDVILTGPIPTPAVSMLTKSLRASYGIMISASHNLFEDNGIKIFDSNGIKINDETEHDIERMLQFPCEKFYAESKKVGKIKRLDDVIGRYIEFIKSSIPKDITFHDLRIVLDVANGAGYKVAPEILTELGAEVHILNNEPNGENINYNCGSMHPSIISSKVKELGFDIGIALDGDADRLIICDENGNLIDGDYIIATIAKHMKEEMRFSNDTVVLTVMSNSGLEKFLHEMGIKTLRTKVGDKNVIHKMLEHNANLGGEQSGHIIVTDYSKTGDGILAAIQVIGYLVKHKLKASSISNLFTKIPQIFSNIKLNHAKRINLSSDEIRESVTKYENILAESGRLLIRKSGTENLIRIMIEGDNVVLNMMCMRELEAYFREYLCKV